MRGADLHWLRMEQLFPITSVLAKYAVGIAAIVIAAATAFVVWIALRYSLREFPHPAHSI